MGKTGRIVLPAKLRKALELQAGDALVMRLENDSVRMIPLHQALNLAQKAVRQYVPEGTALVDALIQARREDAGQA